MLPLSAHARFEMERRGIKESEVTEVFERPQQKIKLEGNREIWQNKMEKEGRLYILRIVVETRPKTLIVTAYRSSKIKKYWRADS